MRRTVIFIIISLTIQAISAQNILKTKQVNIFKNGTYFISKEGNVTIKDKKAIIPFKNEPLLGTFWLTSGNEAEISNVVFRTDTIKKVSTAQTFTEILQANTGKKIKIGYKVDGNTFREIGGTLHNYNKFSGIAGIKTAENKTIFLSVSDIKELTIEETPADKFSSDTIMGVAIVEFTKQVTSPLLKMLYMQQGIQWIPMYNIRIINDKELLLNMQAVVENYSEEIEKADLTLTVGNPQFFFGQTIDPVGKTYFSESDASYRAGYNVNNLPAAQAYGLSNTIMAEERSAYYDYDYNSQNEFSTAGEKSNDLYMYNIGEVSLPKNTKTTFSIFSSKLSYEDVYEVSINDISNYYYNRYVNNDPEKRYDVFHSFKLSNTTKNPLTTAPVFVLNEKNQPLAQDRLKYTPAGGTVSVQLAKAGDVIVKNNEEEINISENAKKAGRIIYRKATIKGTIEIENLQEKNIQLNVKKNLTANVTKAGKEGKIVKSGKYADLNPISEINWEIKLKSNEKTEVDYEYEVLIRSN